MFEAGVPLADHRELQEAGDRAFGVLRGACEVVVAGLPGGQASAGHDDGAAHLGRCRTASPACSPAATRPGARCR